MNALPVVLVVFVIGAVALVVGRQSRSLAIRVTLVLVGWASLVAVLANAGLLQHPTQPRLLVLPLLALGSMLLVRTSATFRAVLHATPLWWLIAAQGFRVVVELWLHEVAPLQLTWSGRNFDVFVGLSAPVVAWLVRSQRLGRLGRLGVRVWNSAGLLVLANTISVAVRSLPGRLFNPDFIAFPALTTWPTVWLPAVLAPFAVFLHLSIFLKLNWSLDARSLDARSEPAGDLRGALGGAQRDEGRSAAQPLATGDERRAGPAAGDAG